MLDLTPQPSWGEPFTQRDWETAVARIGCTSRDLWAVIRAETRNVGMVGFLADKRPVIVYERQWFHRLTNGRYAGIAPPLISHPYKVERHGTFASQWNKLYQAMTYDEAAALKSCSWGIGQVLGVNYPLGGWASVEAYVDASCRYESSQLFTMTGFIVQTDGCAEALRTQRWGAFKRIYNGTGENDYEERLVAEYAALERGLPDIRVRTAQAYLRYAGFDPGPIDGMFGTRTASALRRALAPVELPQGLSAADITDDMLATLRQRAAFPSDTTVPVPEESPMLALARRIEEAVAILHEGVAILHQDIARLRDELQHAAERKIR